MRGVAQCIAGALVCFGLSGSAFSEMMGELVMFDFEKDLQDWNIPDWAREKPDNAGKIVSLSDEFASHGTSSMQLLAEFPGGKWTGAYVEVMMYVTDWNPYHGLSMDVYLPSNAPKGLTGRIILTVGEQWTWTEMNRGIALEPGQWTTVTVRLTPDSLDWKSFPTEAFRKDIRKVGFRIESDKSPTYTGPAYIDNIRLTQ